MVEHVIRNDGVGGSSPFSGTIKFKQALVFNGYMRTGCSPLARAARPAGLVSGRAGTDTKLSVEEACIIRSLINAADARLVGVSVNTLPTDWGTCYDRIKAAQARQAVHPGRAGCAPVQLLPAC
jgi:hypothetical protein